MEDAVALAVMLARRFEGLSLRPYLCPAGVPTIGYGATYYEDGTRVSMQDAAITPERADALLGWMLSRVYLPSVMVLCPHVSGSKRLAALLDFCFNVGAGNLKVSTLRKRVNAEAWTDVPGELAKWNKAGGRVLAGLVKRRQAEAALIL